MTWRNPKLKAVTRRGGTANPRVSAPWGSGHTSPSHLGQLCEEMMEIPSWKPTPEDLPVSWRRRQPTLTKNHNCTCNWGSTKQNTAYKSAFSELATTQTQGNADDSTSSSRGCRGGWERQLWAGACCSWLCVLGSCCCTDSLWLILQEMLTQSSPQGSLRALSSCTGLQVACPGAQPCCTTVTCGCCGCPALQGRARRCQSSATSQKEKCSKLPCPVQSCQC